MNNEVTMKKANAELVKEARRQELAARTEIVKAQVKKVLENAAATAGVTGYEMDDRVFPDFENITLRNVQFNHSIDLYFRNTDWRSGDDSVNARTLRFGVCSMGTFGAEDADKCAYYALCGHYARHISEIEAALKAVEGWEELEEARKSYRFACEELEAIVEGAKREARAEAEAKVAEKLVVGAELAVAVEKKFDLPTHEYVVTGFQTKKVEKMTNKLVWFENDYRQYKKADVIGKLVTGLKDWGWSFADEVTVEDFAK